MVGIDIRYIHHWHRQRRARQLVYYILIVSYYSSKLL